MPKQHCGGQCREQDKAGDKMRDLTETRSRRALQVILRAFPLTVDKMRRCHNVAIREQHDLTYFNRITLALLVTDKSAGVGRGRGVNSRAGSWRLWKRGFCGPGGRSRGVIGF